MQLENSKIGKLNRVVLGATAMGIAAALPGGWALAGTITPPSSVPNSYSISNPVATSTAGYTLGLAATTYSISPTTNLVSGGPGNLEGGPGTSGYPNLQGMANLETLVLNGNIVVQPNGLPGVALGSASYSVTKSGTTTDTGINTNSGINTGLGGNSIIDEIGYVYASQAGQTYNFNVSAADDGTEVLLGGNGTTGSGTVVAAQNASDSLGSGISFNTAVTFTSAGLYRFEIFNAQTWGSSVYYFAPTGSTQNAPALTFYSGGLAPASAPAPTPLDLAGAGLIGFGAIGLRRRFRMAGRA